MVKLQGMKKMCIFLLQSAAALCIGVGSFSDPDDIPGFAHFLEHSKYQCIGVGSFSDPDDIPGLLIS